MPPVIRNHPLLRALLASMIIAAALLGSQPRAPQRRRPAEPDRRESLRGWIAAIGDRGRERANSADGRRARGGAATLDVDPGSAQRPRGSAPLGPDLAAGRARSPRRARESPPASLEGAVREPRRRLREQPSRSRFGDPRVARLQRPARAGELHAADRPSGRPDRRRHAHRSGRGVPSGEARSRRSSSATAP